ncbi:dysbindin domain-containing protein 1 isoform X2 [Mustela lutreola]|uniref:dysbindin domain-containing protein 1 isoform X2 n=1 Tax=Mustela lutreola TaxID=9666 RepID=UPI00279734C7|nr:dysbindin domain-containing protein 1 isoform X2 [Mustela lutreola]
MLGGTRAPEQLRAPPRGLLPAAAAPRLLPRCAAPGAGAESPPQLQGRPGWVTPPPPAPLPDPAGRMEPPEGAGPGEIVKDVEAPQAALGTLAHGTGDSCHSPTAEEEVGIPIPAPGLLQVTERRQVHFDLLDLTELTDMSDQELAEVFADSDDESLAGESPAEIWAAACTAKVTRLGSPGGSTLHCPPHAPGSSPSAPGEGRRPPAGCRCLGAVHRLLTEAGSPQRAGTQQHHRVRLAQHHLLQQHLPT